MPLKPGQDSPKVKGVHSANGGTLIPSADKGGERGQFGLQEEGNLRKESGLAVGEGRKRRMGKVIDGLKKVCAYGACKDERLNFEG